MNKQSIIANVNPKKKKSTRSRKEAAAKLREESFNQAYQKEQEQKKAEEEQEKEVVAKEQSNTNLKEDVASAQATKNESEDKAPASQEKVVEAKPVNTVQEKPVEIASDAVQEQVLEEEQVETPVIPKKAKRGPKKKKREDGATEITYATITVHQNVSKVVKLASTMIEANKLDFTTDAVRHYIKHLKKSGKLPDMPSLDL